MFPDNMITLMKQKKITKKQICSDLGIGINQIKYWETNRNIPDADVILKIASYLGTTSAHIMELPGSVNPAASTDENKNDPPSISESEEKLLELFREVPEADRYMVIQMVEAALAAKRRERYMEEELGISYIRNPDPRYVARKDAGKKLAELEKVGKK
jgi:transcriptional regulator with XRE-family HTH domain